MSQDNSFQDLVAKPESAAATRSAAALDPFAISAGLLWNDRFILPVLFIVLCLSLLVDLLLQHLGQPSWAAVVVLDRVVQVAVVSYIVMRWRRRLQAGVGAPLSFLRVTTRIGVISVISSVLLAMPFLGLVLNSGSGLGALFFIVLGILGIVWCLRVYFFFAIAGILGTSVAPGLAHAVLISKRDGMAAIRSLITPIGATIFLTALLSIPNPDGRSLIWTSWASTAEGLFWILSTYTALGYALTVFGDSAWRAAGLTPYRIERLATIEKQGGVNLPKYLKPRFGLGLLFVGALCMMTTLNRQLTQPPAASIVVKNVSVEDYQVKVELEVADRDYKFRGFYPVAFSLKTKTGFAISDAPNSASLLPNADEKMGAIVSLDGAPRRVYLTFKSGKTAQALGASDNIWLWYKWHPVQALSLNLNSAVAAQTLRQ